MSKRNFYFEMEGALWKHKVARQQYWGPLHTRAISRDHETVRAQKKVSKGRPNTPPTSWSVATYPQV